MSSPSPDHAGRQPPALPLVITVGFAGSRKFLQAQGDALPSAEQVDAFEKLLTERLAETLRKLPQKLGLTKENREQYFFCGVSQIAVGGDHCFTKACKELGISQRLFLPLPWDAYSRDRGSKGPDFTAEQKKVTEDLRQSPHIIQERVISLSADRHERFEDVNLEIVKVSDVLVCLLRDESEALRGGTQDLINRAILRKRPVLLITVKDNEGTPEFRERWLFASGEPPVIQEVETPIFIPPALALELAPMPRLPGKDGPPDIHEYATTLKTYASAESKKHSRIFKYGAMSIIFTHLLATVAAVVAVQKHGDMVKIVLGLELVFLATGFCVHGFLHRSHAVLHWAFSRLVAELTRSVLAVGRRHVYLDYLFRLPLPASLQPLLRSLNVLQLKSTTPKPTDSWTEAKSKYVKNRLENQLEYYRRQADAATHWHNRAHRIFNVCTVAAFLATLSKLTMKCMGMHSDLATGICGALAIILPVLAVGSLSLAAATDLEARKHTFEDMHQFLLEQKGFIAAALSEREFDKLMLETEARLLGETANWFARRSFTGVA